MLFGYVFNIGYDESADGFDIDISDDDIINMSSLDGYNGCADMNKIKTLSELKNYIMAKWDKITKTDIFSEEVNKEVFEELIEIIDKNMINNASKKN